jgi:hypothetical protein
MCARRHGGARRDETLTDMDDQWRHSLHPIFLLLSSKSAREIIRRRKAASTQSEKLFVS